MEFKISEEKHRVEKTGAKEAVVMILLISMFLSIVFGYEYFEFAFPLSIVIGLVFCVLRWRRYNKTIEMYETNKMFVKPDSIRFVYPGGETKLETESVSAVHINYKSNDIKSIYVILPDKTKLLFEGYENMEKLAQIFARKIGEHNVKHHKWFHKKPMG